MSNYELKMSRATLLISLYYKKEVTKIACVVHVTQILDDFCVRGQGWGQRVGV